MPFEDLQVFNQSYLLYDNQKNSNSKVSKIYMKIKDQLVQCKFCPQSRANRVLHLVHLLGSTELDSMR